MDARERLIRIVLVLLLLYAAGCLAAVGRRVHSAELRLQELRQELACVEQATAALRAESGTPDDAALEALARRRLGLVLPGETIFLFPGEEAG